MVGQVFYWRRVAQREHSAHPPKPSFQASSVSWRRSSMCASPSERSRLLFSPHVGSCSEVLGSSRSRTTSTPWSGGWTASQVSSFFQESKAKQFPCFHWHRVQQFPCYSASRTSLLLPVDRRLERRARARARAYFWLSLLFLGLKAGPFTLSCPAG